MSDMFSFAYHIATNMIYIVDSIVHIVDSMIDNMIMIFKKYKFK